MMGDRLHDRIAVAAGAFLCFVAGLAAAEFEFGPVRRALGWVYAAVERVVEHPETSRRIHASPLWAPTTQRRTGVVRRDRKAAFDGHTLVLWTHRPGGALLDMKGQERHRWEPAAGDDGSRESAPDPLFWRAAHVYPNGDIVVAREAESGTPRLRGIARYNRASATVWTYDGPAGAFVTVDEQGFVYALEERVGDRAIDALPQLHPPFIEEYLTVLSPDGRRVVSASLPRILARSLAGTEYEPFLRVIAPRTGEGALGVHAVRIVPDTFAVRIPGVEPGQVLVSMRAASLVATLDFQRGGFTWLAQGPWRRQSGLDLTPDGRVALFDTGNPDWGPRVIRFDPAAQQVEWAWPAPGSGGLRSVLWGQVQALPNGSLLIADAQAGRLLEVTPEQDVAWEWSVRDRGGRGRAYVPAVFGGRRYAANQVPFLFRGP